MKKVYQMTNPKTQKGKKRTLRCARRETDIPHSFLRVGHRYEDECAGRRKTVKPRLCKIPQKTKKRHL